MGLSVNDVLGRVVASGTVSSTTANVAATTACRVMGWHLRNTAANGSLVIADATSLATDGTAPLTALNASTVDSRSEWYGPQGIKFSTGLSFRTNAMTTIGIVFYVVE